MNMKAKVKDLSLEELRGYMDQKKSEINMPEGDLITVFPIPDNYNY